MDISKVTFLEQENIKRLEEVIKLQNQVIELATVVGTILDRLIVFETNMKEKEK